MPVPSAVPGPRLSVEEQRAWRGFLVAHARTTLALDRELYAGTGIRLGDFDVLAHLADADGRLRMHQLADACALSPSGLTRRFDALARRGWVDRSTCDEDGRGVYALLTPEGRAALDAARPAHAAAIRRLFVDSVEPATVTLLGDAMHTIAANLTAPEAVAPAAPTPDSLPAD